MLKIKKKYLVGVFASFLFLAGTLFVHAVGGSGFSAGGGRTPSEHVQDYNMNVSSVVDYPVSVYTNENIWSVTGSAGGVGRSGYGITGQRRINLGYATAGTIYTIRISVSGRCPHEYFNTPHGLWSNPSIPDSGLHKGDKYFDLYVNSTRYRISTSSRNELVVFGTTTSSGNVYLDLNVGRSALLYANGYPEILNAEAHECNTDITFMVNSVTFIGPEPVLSTNRPVYEPVSIGQFVSMDGIPSSVVINHASDFDISHGGGGHTHPVSGHPAWTGEGGYYVSDNPCINNWSNITGCVDSSTKMHYWTSGNYSTESRVQTLGLGEYVYKGAELNFDMWVQGCNCNNNFPFKVSLYKVGSSTPKQTWTATPPSILTSTTKCDYDDDAAHSGLAWIFYNSFGRTGLNEVSYSFDEDGSYYLKFDFSSAANYTGSNHCVKEENYEDGDLDETKWREEIIPQAYVTSLSFRNPFYLEVRDYDTYNGDGKNRKELIATYQYICGWSGNTNTAGNLTLDNSKISIDESVQSAYQSIKKYAHGVPLGRSDDLGAYYNWYYCYDWAVNNPVTKQASGADEMVIRFKPSDSSKYSKFVVERYFKPVEYDIYIHENGYNVKDGDITYDVVANKSYLESSGFVSAYGYQTKSSDKFVDTGDPDTSYERRGKVWKQHYVYRYKKVGLLPQKAFTLKGWTADNSGYLVKPENATIDLPLPIDTGTDAVKRYFVADYNTVEGRRTNRLDLYVLWHRNKYEITYDCKLSTNAVNEGKSAEDYASGGSQYFAPGATYHGVTSITKRIENSNGGSIDGTKKKVYMDLPYNVTPNGSNSSSTSYQTVDGKTVHGLGPFNKDTASGSSYATSTKLAYNEKTRPVTPNSSVSPKAYWRVEVYPHGDGAANRAFGQRTFSGSEGLYSGYQKDARNNAVPLDSYKVNTSNIEARDAVNAYSKRYDLSTVASYGSRYQSTSYGGTSSAPAYDVGSSSDSPIKAGSYATSYSGNKSYVMFVQSTFEGWYRKRANNISPSLDRDKYSEHLRNKITNLSSEFGNDTLNQGSHATAEVGYKSYIGVESDSSAYRKVRGDTKMTVASDHTLMGTWRNNSLILGVPKREYTVTFHGGFNQNDVNLNGKTGFSAYSGLTPVLTDPDASVAWNNPSRDTSVYTYVHKWDFEGWGTRNCDSAGDVHWGSGDCRSGVLGSATSSRSHIESDANLNTVGNYQYINNGSSGNNGKDGTIAFTPTSHCKVYAHWEDPGLRLPEVYRAGYEFIGWYTKPQTHPGSPTIDSDGDALFSNAGLLYGGGDGWDYNWSANYKVTGDLHLYAWYNKLPTFVDIYEGLFFEGQHVSYDDLLQLIGVYDYEDNYRELQNATIKSYFDGLVNKVDADIYDHQEELSHLESEYHVWVYDYPEDDSDHGDGWKEKWEEKKKQYELDMDEVRGIIHELFVEKETIEQQREQAVQAIPNRAKLLKVLIGGIKYYGSGRSVDYHYTDEAHKTTCHVFTRTLTSDGYKNEKVRDLYQVRDLSDKYKRMYLETMTRNIGLFDITYQVHDEGIWYTDASAPGGKTMVPGSDVTLEYTRRCRINFNYNPVINSQSLILDSDNDSSVTSTLSELLMRGQAVIDSEDVEDNIPWWRSDYKSKSSSSLLLHPADNDKTVPKLQSTLAITGVKDFTFASDFENVDTNKEAIRKFKEEFTSPELQQSPNHAAHDTSIGEYWVKDREDGHVYKTTIWDKSKLLNAIYEFSKSSEDYYGVPKNELWRNLTSMDVTFDAMDQWGKWASNFINAGQYRSSKPEDDPDPDKWDKYNDPDPKPGDSDDPSHPDDPVPWGIDPGKEPDGFDNPDNTGGYDPDKEPDDLDNPDDPDDNPDPNDKDPLPEPDPNPPSDDPYPPDVMQEEPERTVKIIIVTKDSDIEVKDALVQSRVRFISDNWYDTLLNSFWGTNGKDELKGVLESTPAIKADPDYSGSRDNLKVNVRDYSD